MDISSTQRGGCDAGLGLDATEDHRLVFLLSCFELLNKLRDHHGEAGLGVRHNVVLGQLYLGHCRSQAFRILLRRKGGNWEINVSELFHLGETKATKLYVSYKVTP